MSISYSGVELIGIAIGIERSGIAFYDIINKSTKNAVTRNLFKYLTDMERGHLKLFQGMLAAADKYEIPETCAQEYSPYLQALIDSAVFTEEKITGEMATRADTSMEALELAIVAEKDSILFYNEMKEMMSQEAKETLSKIIAEEKSHFEKLSALKKKLVTI